MSTEYFISTPSLTVTDLNGAADLFDSELVFPGDDVGVHFAGGHVTRCVAFNRRIILGTALLIWKRANTGTVTGTVTLTITVTGTVTGTGTGTSEVADRAEESFTALSICGTGVGRAYRVGAARWRMRARFYRTVELLYVPSGRCVGSGSCCA